MRRIMFVMVLLGGVSTVLAETVQRNLAIKLESEVFARRGNTIVTQADFDARMDRIPEADRAGVLADPKRIGALLDDLLLMRALAEKGIEAGMLDNPELQAVLWHAAMTIIAENHARQVVDEAELDDYAQQAREIWLAGNHRPRLPQRFDFTHILVSTHERSDIEAARRVLDVQAQLNDGVAFPDLIAEYSDDPSAVENQGSFTEVATSELDQGFAAALAELAEPGEFSEPVRTPYGWHIIRLDQSHPPREMEYEEALPELEVLARQRYRERVREQYYASLYEQPREIEEGAVEKLLKRYGVHQALTGEE